MAPRPGWACDQEIFSPRMPLQLATIPGLSVLKDCKDEGGWRKSRAHDAHAWKNLEELPGRRRTRNRLLEEPRALSLCLCPFPPSSLLFLLLFFFVGFFSPLKLLASLELLGGAIELSFPTVRRLGLTVSILRWRISKCFPAGDHKQGGGGPGDTDNSSFTYKVNT